MRLWPIRWVVVRACMSRTAWAITASCAMRGSSLRRWTSLWPGLAARCRPRCGCSAGPPWRDGAVDAEPMRHRRGFYPTAHAELGQDVRHVHAGRLGADEQDPPDLGGGPAGRELGQHLALALGEPEPGQFVGRR